MLLLRNELVGLFRANSRLAVCYYTGRTLPRGAVGIKWHKRLFSAKCSEREKDETATGQHQRESRLASVYPSLNNKKTTKLVIPEHVKLLSTGGVKWEDGELLRVLQQFSQDIEADPAHDFLSDLTNEERGVLIRQLTTGKADILSITLLGRMLTTTSKLLSEDKWNQLLDIFEVWIDCLKTNNLHQFRITPTITDLRNNSNLRQALTALTNALVSYAILLNHPITASSLCHDLSDSRLVRSSTVRDCIRALLVEHPSESPYRIRAVQVLCEAFASRFILDPAMCGSLINSGIVYGTHQYPGFANDCYELARKYGEAIPSRPLYQLLLLNIKHQNFTKAIEIWSVLLDQNSCLDEHDINSIASLLFRLSKESRFRAFAHALAQAVDSSYYSLEGLGEALIVVAARVKNKTLFHSVMAAQKQPLRRSLLFPLLKYYLHTASNRRKNTTEINEVVELILNSEGGLTPDELAELVRYYCRSEDGYATAQEFLIKVSHNWHPRRLEKSYAALANGMIEQLAQTKDQGDLESLDRAIESAMKRLEVSRSREIYDIAANLKLKWCAVQGDLPRARSVWQNLVLADAQRNIPRYSIKSRKIGLTTVVDMVLRIQKRASCDISVYPNWLVSECDILGMTYQEIRGLVKNRAIFKRLDIDGQNIWIEAIDNQFNRGRPCK